MPDWLAQYMRDINGVVHQMMGNGISWTWPSGHADASLRRAEPVREGGFVTCFRCIDEHLRFDAFLRRTGRLPEQ